MKKYIPLALLSFIFLSGNCYRFTSVSGTRIPKSMDKKEVSLKVPYAVGFSNCYNIKPVMTRVWGPPSSIYKNNSGANSDMDFFAAPPETYILLQCNQKGLGQSEDSISKETGMFRTLGIYGRIFTLFIAPSVRRLSYSIDVTRVQNSVVTNKKTYYIKFREFRNSIFASSLYYRNRSSPGTETKFRKIIKPFPDYNKKYSVKMTGFLKLIAEEMGAP